ncbi:MAG: FAD-dependent oxidoreductase [Betaproteobacteria bacterium]|nr:FAD-dependent oxidoreductase [Betaproteobacteria bacterium]
MKRITVIGAGFAALTAIRTLARKAEPSSEITLVAPRAELLYYPSLIWIPTGLRRAEDLVVPIMPFLHRHRIKFHAGRVTGLRENGRIVVTDQGEIANDALLIASGGAFLKGLPGIEHTLTMCEGIPAAERIKARLGELAQGTLAFGFGTNPKEQSAMRGGPMFELLFGIDTWLRRAGRREAFRLVFFNAATQPGKRLGDKAVEGLLREMKRRGIETHLGHKILGFEPNAVKTEGGDIRADLIAFMPGMTGASWFKDSGLPLSDGGMLKANALCQVEGTTGVYVAGDGGSYPGPDWMPKQAHLADLQATAAAKNIWTELQGGHPSATFKPELVCIVDTLDKGILVYRNTTRAFVFGCRAFHWAKRFFEWTYLRRYRA